jgi:hemoglobin
MSDVDPMPYDALGGEDGVRRLVDRFYDLMDELPEARAIRAMHDDDLTMIRDKLTTFLVGWLGGPRRYAERFGRVSIPAAHRPFPIGPAERDAWLVCMEKALEEAPIDAALRARLMVPMRQMGEMCRTRD